MSDYQSYQTEAVRFFPLSTPPAHLEGLVYYDADRDTLVVYNSISGVSLNVGEEMWIQVYNDTGSPITIGSVVKITNSVVSGRPTIELAKADSPDTSKGIIGIATNTIADGTIGVITNFGIVTGVNTGGLAAGDELYLSASAAGGFTKTQPIYPNYIIRLGTVTVVDASDGELMVNISGRIEDILENAWNGNILETVDFTITSDGAIITGSLEREGGGDLTMNFSDGLTVLDTTPAQTITLTGGSATVPTVNYIYIPVSTKVLTVSTVYWPSEEHIKVANAVLLDAAETQGSGALGNRNWNDHIAGTDQQGHILHVDERIRVINAQWDTGVVPTLSINAQGGAPDDVFFKTTSGFVYQMHRQTFPATNMETGDDAHIVNDFTTPYTTTSNLNSVLADAGGSTLVNKYFNLVFWGIQNRTGEASHIMVNLPTDSYALAAPAIRDDNKTSVFTIPTAFRGVGFLIARVTLQHNSAASGTWTLHNTEDLRGTTPQIAGGVTSPVVTEFDDGAFRVQNTADITKELALDVSGVTTSTTRTLTIPDKNGTIAVVADQQVQVTTKSASTDAALVDNLHVIEYTNGSSDYTYTIPPNSSVAFPIGSWIILRKTGTGEITIAKGGGVTFRHQNFGDNNVKIDGQDGYSIYIEKTATDTWLLSGSIKAV